MSATHDACAEINGRLQCALDLLNDYRELTPAELRESWAPNVIADLIVQCQQLACAAQAEDDRNAKAAAQKAAGA